MGGVWTFLACAPERHTCYQIVVKNRPPRDGKARFGGGATAQILGEHAFR
jgi:hypothetical protein